MIINGRDVACYVSTIFIYPTTSHFHPKKSAFRPFNFSYIYICCSFELSMKKYIIISVLTAILFLSNCSKDIYRNTAGTPVLFTQQLVNSFKNRNEQQIEVLRINRAELIETLTQNQELARKYSLSLIRLAGDKQAFNENSQSLLAHFAVIKKNRKMQWENIQLYQANYKIKDNQLEMSGNIIIKDTQKHLDTITFEAVKLQDKWYLTKLGNDG